MYHEVFQLFCAFFSRFFSIFQHFATKTTDFGAKIRKFPRKTTTKWRKKLNFQLKTSANVSQSFCKVLRCCSVHLRTFLGNNCIYFAQNRLKYVIFYLFSRQNLKIQGAFLDNVRNAQRDDATHMCQRTCQQLSVINVHRNKFLTVPSTLAKKELQK